MSKVKGEFINAHEKSKLRKSLRRKETAHKKIDRIKKAKNNTYKYPCGYAVRDEQRMGSYESVIIPEHMVDVVEYYYERLFYPELGYSIMVPRRKIVGQRRVPEKTVKKHTKTYYVDIPERPVRMNCTKKFYKKESNRRVRRSKELFNNGSYKKVYDLWWELC